MTSPNGAVPEGAYVAGGSGQGALTDLNGLTAEAARARMRQQVVPTFQAQRDGLWSRLQDMLNVISGTYTGAVAPFVDAQSALTDRLDLLGKSGYCAAYMGQNLRLGPGRNRALPFDSQLGPASGAALDSVVRTHPGVSGSAREERVIRLDRKGLWQVSCQFVHAGDGFDTSNAEICVLRPDGSVFSSTVLPAARPHSDGGSTTSLVNGCPVSLFTMVVVPDPGYYVQVRWQFFVLIGIRTAKGGSQMTRLVVTQWSDDVENTGLSDATGTIDDTN